MNLSFSHICHLMNRSSGCFLNVSGPWECVYMHTYMFRWRFTGKKSCPLVTGKLKASVCFANSPNCWLVRAPLDWEEIQPVHSEGDLPWDFCGRNDAKAETPVLWPPHAKSWLIGKDWCWKGLGAGGEGDDRGWDGWMASRTQWTWVWVNSGRWRWTGRPGVLRFMGSQSRTRLSDWTELNWRTELRESLRLLEKIKKFRFFCCCCC